MEISFRELHRAYAIIQRYNKKEMPINLAFHFSNFIKESSNFLQAFENERILLVTEFADESGMEVDPNKLPEYMDRMNKNMDNKIDFPFQPLKLLNFNFEINIDEMMEIGCLFE